MSLHDDARSRPTVTERIDRAVLAAQHKRAAALLALTLLGLVAMVSAVPLAEVLLAGEPARAVGPLLVLGLLTPALLLLVCIALRRPPGCAFWISLLLGGVLIAAGPVLALLSNGWHAQVHVPGRWGGSTADLIMAAPLLWGLAALMVGPGLAGTVRAIARAR